MAENIALIKSYRIDLLFLADKLVEKKIMNTRQRAEVTDMFTGCTEDERMDELLHTLTASIKVEGDVFGTFLEILKKEDTILSHSLAKKLSDAYDAKIDDVDKRVSIDEGKNKKCYPLAITIGSPS